MRVPSISDNAQTLDPASFIGQWPLVCPDCRATLSAVGLLVSERSIRGLAALYLTSMH